MPSTLRAPAGVPSRGSAALAGLFALAYFVVGLATYDPMMTGATTEDWATGGMLVLTAAWVLVIIGGGALLGIFWGTAYAVAIAALTIPISWLSTGTQPMYGASMWTFTFFFSGVFGAVAGALGDHYRQARTRTAQLAAANKELTQTTEALRRSETMFREFADRADFGMWIAPVDPPGAPFANAAIRKLFAMEPGETAWDHKIHPEDRKRVHESAVALHGGAAQDIEYRVKLPGQEARWLRAQSFAVTDPAGKITNYAGVIEDVTERKDREAKRELIERRERLTALGTLVAGVAHEINNPLTYVMGNMELAKMEFDAIAERHDIPREDSARIERLMTTSHEGSERIARIVRALRAVTRGGSSEPVSNVDLNNIATNVHALMRTSVPPTIELDLVLSERPVIVRGSSGELHQILLNLASNAVQAMGKKPGRVVIETRLDSKSASILVRDEGPGISADVRARLFTPFFTTKSEGTGLGLSIAHAIVRDHDGDIEIESREGEGATFRVRLPRLASPMQEVPA